MKRLIAVTSSFALLSCAAPVAPDAIGQWGSQQASLAISRQGGTLMLQCGSGRIDSTWSLSDDGVFTATGATFGGGGPEPIGGRPPQPSRFSGRVSGSIFTLTATVIASNSTIGPFKMLRGGVAVSQLCL